MSRGGSRGATFAAAWLALTREVAQTARRRPQTEHVAAVCATSPGWRRRVRGPGAGRGRGHGGLARVARRGRGSLLVSRNIRCPLARSGSLRPARWRKPLADCPRRSTWQRFAPLRRASGAGRGGRARVAGRGSRRATSAALWLAPAREVAQTARRRPQKVRVAAVCATSPVGRAAPGEAPGKRGGARAARARGSRQTASKSPAG